MDHTTGLLTETYENAELCSLILARLIKITQDSEFRNTMAEQFAEYHNILDDAERLLGDCGESPKKHKTGAVSAPIFASIKLHAMIDRTSSHFAEMIMQGSVMAIIDVTRSINEFSGADESAMQLAKRLISTEENNLRQMRSFV